MALIKFGQGTYQNYAALESKSQYEVFFCTDTHQIFVGAQEYTKGTKVLNAEPTTSTPGDQDRLYAYNGSLYLYQGEVSEEHQWLRVANVNDDSGSVTSVAAGDGLETESGSAITTSGTIKHAVPTGASTVADTLADQTPAFGSTFAINGLATDKFGHVTAVNEHTVTLPTETALDVAAASTSSSTLTPGDSFTVITAVDKGAGSHELASTAVTFTLPSDQNVTYEISSETEGVVTLTGSDASASTALISGWNDLAKKSDITAVFRFKGTKATASELTTTADIGDVWYVTDEDSEYVCVDDTAGAAGWEQLGPVIDLTAYATTAYVNEKLTWDEF